MLTVKPVYKLSNVSDDMKWATNTHYDTIYIHLQGMTKNIYGIGRLFAPSYIISPVSPPIFLPVHIGLYPSN